VFLKSDAIVIGRRHVMNTSLSLRFYTRRYGRMAVIAKGAFRRRRKAEPPSVPDLFQRGEVVLWVSALRETAILHEWSPDDFRTGVRADYGRFCAAAGCAALVSALSPGSAPWERPHAEDGGRGEHFAALDGALGELDLGGAERPVLWAFVMQELARAGFLAPAGSCAACGRVFRGARGRKRDGGEPCGEATGLMPGAGGFVCGDCASKERTDDGDGNEELFISLPAEAAASARFLSTSPVRAAAKLRLSPRASSALDRAVRAFAEYHLERAMPELARARALEAVGA
jgi:recombinational DNA repair protein (RecF pathway)